MSPKTLLRFAIPACVCIAMFSQAADDGVHWTYEGEHGPETWGDLSPDFIQCKVGLNQSPIDIVDSIEANLPPLVLDYQTRSVDLINNGHTAQMNVEPGNYLRVGGEEFELLQFHIHVPSEHRINGEASLLEVHYVHRNKRGELAVIGVLYFEGEDHPKLAQYISLIPEEIGKPVPLEVELADMPIVSMDKDYYRYNGSLTTPPCTEGVRWYVLKAVGPISKKRRDRFNQLIGDDARGPQPINARPVLR
ncbi:MAG: carbonic anhydrase family protein [Halioglobus sp.]